MTARGPTLEDKIDAYFRNEHLKALTRAAISKVPGAVVCLVTWPEKETPLTAEFHEFGVTAFNSHLEGGIHKDDLLFTGRKGKLIEVPQ